MLAATGTPGRAGGVFAVMKKTFADKLIDVFKSVRGPGCTHSQKS